LISMAVLAFRDVVQWTTTARGSKRVCPRVVQPLVSVTLIPLAFRMEATFRILSTW